MTMSSCFYLVDVCHYLFGNNNKKEKAGPLTFPSAAAASAGEKVSGRRWRGRKEVLTLKTRSAQTLHGMVERWW